VRYLTIERQFSDSSKQVLFNASATRFNVAVVFFNAGHQADALEYAKAALQGFESYGERAAEMIEKTRGLIAEIRGQ
jgi:hypothetical protein